MSDFTQTESKLIAHTDDRVRSARGELLPQLPGGDAVLEEALGQTNRVLTHDAIAIGQRWQQVPLLQRPQPLERVQRVQAAET